MDPNVPYTDGTVADLSKSARVAGIDISVVMPIATSAKSSMTINSFAAQVDKMPGLRSFGSVHPNYTGALGGELETIKTARPVRDASIRIPKRPPRQSPQHCRCHQTRCRAWAMGAVSCGRRHRTSPLLSMALLRVLPGLKSAAPDAKIILPMGGFRMWKEAEQVFGDGHFYRNQLQPRHPPGGRGALSGAYQADWHRRRCFSGPTPPWADQKAVLQTVQRFLSENGFTKIQSEAILGGNAAKNVGSG